MWLPDDVFAVAVVVLGHNVEARGVKFKTWQKGRYTNSMHWLPKGNQNNFPAAVVPLLAQ